MDLNTRRNLWVRWWLCYVPQTHRTETTEYDNQHCSLRYTAPPDRLGYSPRETPPCHIRSWQTHTHTHNSLNTTHKTPQNNLLLCSTYDLVLFQNLLIKTCYLRIIWYMFYLTSHSDYTRFISFNTDDRMKIEHRIKIEQNDNRKQYRRKEEEEKRIRIEQWEQNRCEQDENRIKYQRIE